MSIACKVFTVPFKRHDTIFSILNLAYASFILHDIYMASGRLSCLVINSFLTQRQETLNHSHSCVSENVASLLSPFFFLRVHVVHVSLFASYDSEKKNMINWQRKGAPYLYTTNFRNQYKMAHPLWTNTKLKVTGNLPNNNHVSFSWPCRSRKLLNYIF